MSMMRMIMMILLLLMMINLHNLIMPPPPPPGQTWNLPNVLHDKIPNFFNFTCEKRVNRDIFFAKNWEWKMFIWNKLSVFVQVTTKIQTYWICFVKTQAWIWQIAQIGYFFALIFEHFTTAKNILHKYHLCHLWQIPCLHQGDIIIHDDDENDHDHGHDVHDDKISSQSVRLQWHHDPLGAVHLLRNTNLGSR